MLPANETQLLPECIWSYIHYCTIQSFEHWLIGFVNKMNWIEISEPRLNENGVPQGSILVPLSFLIYSSYSFLLTKDTSANLILYANDLTCLIPADSLDTVLRQTEQLINNIHKWFQTKLNFSKTKFSILSKSQNSNSPTEIKSAPSLSVKLPVLKF